MGYRIDYQPQKKEPGSNKRFAIRISLAVIFLFLFVNYIWLSDDSILEEVLFSGNIAVTALALEDFAVNLKKGEALTDAFVVFCQMIIQESDLAPG